MPTTEKRIQKRGVGKKRRVLSKADSLKMAEHARKNRGRDIHSIKPDRALDARIDMVVQMAVASGTCHSTDTVNGFHHVAHSKLSAHRVG